MPICADQGLSETSQDSHHVRGTLCPPLSVPALLLARDHLQNCLCQLITLSYQSLMAGVQRISVHSNPSKFLCVFVFVLGSFCGFEWPGNCGQPTLRWHPSCGLGDVEVKLMINVCEHKFSRIPHKHTRKTFLFSRPGHNL